MKLKLDLINSFDYNKREYKNKYITLTERECYKLLKQYKNNPLNDCNKIQKIRKFLSPFVTRDEFQKRYKNELNKYLDSVCKYLISTLNISYDASKIVKYNTQEIQINHYNFYLNSAFLKLYRNNILFRVFRKLNIKTIIRRARLVYSNEYSHTFFVECYRTKKHILKTGYLVTDSKFKYWWFDSKNSKNALEKIKEKILNEF